MIERHSATPHPSLRQELLRWLIPGTIVILLAAGVVAYAIAFLATKDAYDQGLRDSAIELVEMIEELKGTVPSELPPHAQRVLLVDPTDHVFFRIQSAASGLVAGSIDLRLPEKAPAPDMEVFYETEVGQEHVRAISAMARSGNETLQVAVAATFVKRDRMIQKFLLGMLIPGAILTIASLMFIRSSILSVLSPLDELRRQVALRSTSDLSPIAVTNPPGEIQPLLDEVNHLLVRLSDSLDSQRHFVSEAAHQLRTPIAALQAQVESRLGSAHDAEREQLLRILSATQRLAHLVRQLLALARAESGAQAIQPNIDLAMLIEDRAETWLPFALERNIDLGFDLAAATVAGSSLLLEELIGNLVENAIAYVPKDGKVTVHCRQERGETVLTVEDNGPGIPANQRERVFERFVRLSQDTATGCGLGLPIVKRIAEQHGAEVSIGDAATGGTVVTVRFPKA